jgi:hypothetical protein
MLKYNFSLLFTHLWMCPGISGRRAAILIVITRRIGYKNIRGVQIVLGKFKPVQRRAAKSASCRMYTPEWAAP